jgi:hypothetical protein
LQNEIYFLKVFRCRALGNYSLNLRIEKRLQLKAVGGYQAKAFYFKELKNRFLKSDTKAA